MKIVFLDMASQDALIACCDEQAVLAARSVQARLSDAELIPMIEAALREADWSYADLANIACVIGPGGFTSLRSAVTYVNVLSDQLGIPSAGVHLSELYRARIQNAELGVQNCYWVHSTKKDQLFIQGGKWEVPTLISLEEFLILNSEFSILPWMGELIDGHRTSDPIALAPVTQVLPTLLAAQTYDTTPLTPWYGRGW